MNAVINLPNRSRAFGGVAWNARAVTLAADQQPSTVGTAREVGETSTGGHLWRVPSRHTDGAVYLVTAWHLTGAYTCSCTAGSYGRPCCHVGAVILAERDEADREHWSEMNMHGACIDACRGW